MAPMPLAILEQGGRSAPKGNADQLAPAVVSFSDTVCTARIDTERPDRITDDEQSDDDNIRGRG